MINSYHSKTILTGQECYVWQLELLDYQEVVPKFMFWQCCLMQ